MGLVEDIVQQQQQQFPTHRFDVSYGNEKLGRQDKTVPASWSRFCTENCNTFFFHYFTTGKFVIGIAINPDQTSYSYSNMINYFKMNNYCKFCGKTFIVTRAIMSDFILTLRVFRCLTNQNR